MSSDSELLHFDFIFDEIIYGSDTRNGKSVHNVVSQREVDMSIAQLLRSGFDVCYYAIVVAAEKNRRSMFNAHNAMQYDARFCHEIGTFQQLKHLIERRERKSGANKNRCNDCNDGLAGCSANA